MSTFSVAKKYVELCKSGQHHVILETLFSPDAVSIEAGPSPISAVEVRGVKAIMEKGKKWADTHEIHRADVEGPWPNGNRFIVKFSYDVTNKPTGKRIQMEEGALLTVENDKIVREEFFYSTEG